MKFDLTNLIEKIKEEKSSEESVSRGEGSQYPIVYPAQNGKLTVRILYNPKMDAVQRKIVRHDSGKSKIPCLKVYGEDCPVCSIVDTIETAQGRESGAFRKYGYKTRGMCYAMIVDHDSSYFTGDNDPKVGDIVLLMYPKTVYEKIAEIIIDASENDHVYDIISENEGIPIVIERKQKGNAFPSYEASLFPYGKKKAYEDDAEKTGEEKFDEMLSNLPNLAETMVPSNPTDDIRTASRALAEAINQEYITNNVINPGDKVNVDDTNETTTETDNLGDIIVTERGGLGIINPYNSMIATETSDSKPDCYGHHNADDNKCLLCPNEPECFSDTE